MDTLNRQSCLQIARSHLRYARSLSKSIERVHGARREILQVALVAMLVSADSWRARARDPEGEARDLFHSFTLEMWAYR